MNFISHSNNAMQLELFCSHLLILCHFKESNDLEYFYMQKFCNQQTALNDRKCFIMQWTFIAFRKLHRGLTLKIKFMCNSQFAAVDTYEKLAMHHGMHHHIPLCTIVTKIEACYGFIYITKVKCTKILVISFHRLYSFKSLYAKNLI